MNKNDPQIEQVYEFTNQMREKCRMLDMDGIMLLVDDIFKTDPPVVLLSRASHISYSGIDRICIARCHFDEAVVLHELAHVIQIREYGYEDIPHGNNFMNIYMQLLEKYTKIEKHVIFRIADSLGVNYDIERIRETA